MDEIDFAANRENASINDIGLLLRKNNLGDIMNFIEDNGINDIEGDQKHHWKVLKDGDPYVVNQYKNYKGNSINLKFFKK